MAYKDELREQMSKETLGRIDNWELEDQLAPLTYEPILAAWAIRELFQGVMQRESESSPEYRPEEKKVWDAEMEVFWKCLDGLVGRIVGHSDRPEFNPD